MSAFKVGDRVRHTAELGEGGLGTVTKIQDIDHINVTFDIPISGNRDWSCTRRFLRLVRTETPSEPEPEAEPFEVQLQALNGQWFTVARCAHRSHAETMAGSMGVQYEGVFDTRVLPEVVVTTFVIQTRHGTSDRWRDTITHETLEGASQEAARLDSSSDYTGVRVIKRTEEVVIA